MAKKKYHNDKPEKLINYFDSFEGANDYRFLSNFAPWPSVCDVGWGEFLYPTGEHAFQAAKAQTQLGHHDIQHSYGPAVAKSKGRKVSLRPDWEVVKYDVMMCVLRGKFTPVTDAGRLLLATGDAFLLEGTHWHDSVWGGDLTKPGTPGRNWLGTLLMARRAELRAPVKYQHPTIGYNEEFVRRRGK